MLLEVDRVTEPVDDLVDKIRRYHERFELLAPKADATKEKSARGAAVHAFRLWSRIYPATGREGYVPVAFVFTGKTEAQRASRIQRLEQAARAHFAGTPHRGEGFTAFDYHQAVPVVVTELERITADPVGAAGKVWRRLGRDEWQTLPEALDSPDGERLYAVPAPRGPPASGGARCRSPGGAAAGVYALRRHVHRRALAGDQAVLVAWRVGPAVRAVCQAGSRPRGG
ncbi:hypothetical protein ACWGI0_32920 [Streptomyces sp. NPDC054802]